MNKDKLTQLCHRLSKETGLSFNSVMTYYFLERLLERISSSRYRDNFIFKGGFILSNIVGVQTRTTVDIDMLLSNIKFTKERILEILVEILKDAEGSVISYEIIDVETIKEVDEYSGYRVKVLCRFENIRQIVPLDIATGDAVTPHPIKYSFISIFNVENILIKAYPIETMISEKIHTIFEKSYLNSRSKDFYDLHIIYTLRRKDLDGEILKSACNRTFSTRETVFDPYKILEFLSDIKFDDVFSGRWDSYVKKNSYAQEVSFSSVIDSAISLLKMMSE